MAEETVSVSTAVRRVVLPGKEPLAAVLDLLARRQDALKHSLREESDPEQDGHCVALSSSPCSYRDQVLAELTRDLQALEAAKVFLEEVQAATASAPFRCLLVDPRHEDGPM